MKKTLAGMVFSGVTGYIISAISGYGIMNWQFWAALVPIIITGMVYAFIPK